MVTLPVLLTQHGEKEEKGARKGKKRDKYGGIDAQNKGRMLEKDEDIEARK
jgi:hypothetical protein